ncbi:MAG: YHS domain-containing protein [Thermoprotei archaeon]|nr:MAG: YHS domain-containing protein [Thermoprotei archaeon]
MVKDPVCGMEVDEKTTEYRLEYKGKVYYFCCKSCLEEFRENPSKYVSEYRGCCG